MTWTDQYGLYDGSWKGLIVDEAFAHPAKFARGLICWIIEHGLERGYWQKGDVIGDPFAGIGTGGIIAASNGLRWMGVELEPRFVELAEQNFELHWRTWEGFGDPQPVIVQGDSREFARIVAQCDAAVTSPPFLGARAGTTKSNATSGGGPCADRVRSIGTDGDCMGDTPGQIGSLPAGRVEGVITSPPYVDSSHADWHVNSSPERMTKLYENYKKGGGGMTEAQFRRHCEARQAGYGDSEGQIGSLKAGEVDAVVTSPPYEDSGGTPSLGSVNKDNWGQEGTDICARRGLTADYGTTEGQIGRESAETYWQACAAVYRQMHLALKPGGIAAIVLKDYVKNKQRVPLCDDTCRLLGSLGFEIFERTRCWLVKETRHPDLFGGEDHVERTERKSFFRRLAEAKGSPRIDFEEVLWVRSTEG